MKTPSILRAASISLTLIITLFFMSCSKDSSVNRDSVALNKPVFGPVDPGDQNDQIKTGSAVVQVLPEIAKPELTLFNGSYSTSTYKTDGMNYYFFNVPAGVYTLHIHPLNPMYSDYKVGGLEIRPGQQANFGTIILK